MARYHRERPFYASRESAVKVGKTGEARRGVLPIPANRKLEYARTLLDRHLEKTEVFASSRFRGHDLGNRELPAYQKKRDVMRMVRNNRISMLGGETGSGKTTQLAQYALEMGFDRVVYLMPRRVIVDNIAERIEHELATQLGQAMPGNLVGMAHSEATTVNNDTAIQIMTSGTFTRKAEELGRQWAEKRVLVVADEIHEGNLETEFATAIAARRLEENPSWHMVFSSATPDPESIREAYTHINQGEIPSVTLEGRPHTIEYGEEPDLDVVTAYKKYGGEARRTLIFTDGKRSIKEVIKAIKKNFGTEDEQGRIRFMKLHAKISTAARQALFDEGNVPDEHQRDVIVSTSAGQSGITIPGVDLVITDGWTKSPELDDERVEGLPKRRCTQAEIIQQSGRGGRDIPNARAILTKAYDPQHEKNLRRGLGETFLPLTARDEHIPPDIYHTNIARNVLSAAATDENFHDINKYLVHSVQDHVVDDAYEVLQGIGAVDANNCVTRLGRRMDRYPVRPELSRAIAESRDGHSLDVQLFTLAIAASIESGNLQNFDAKSKKWSELLRPETTDDFMAQLDLFMATRPYFHGHFVEERPLEVLDIDFVNAYRAHRSFDKMCHAIHLNPYDVTLRTPTEPEETEVRRLFLTGMGEIVYRLHRPTHGKIPATYRNVWEEGSIERSVSDRSVMKLRRLGDAALFMVAGYPRWYTKGSGEVRDIIDFGFPTSIDELSETMGQNPLYTQHDIQVTETGELVEVSRAQLGVVELGRAAARNVTAETAEQRKQLVRLALKRPPGPAQRELRGLKGTLQDLRARIPRKQWPYYINRSDNFTQEDLEDALYEASAGVTNINDLDARLWEVIDAHDYRLSSWLDEETIATIDHIAPLTMHGYNVKYIHAESIPVLTNVDPSQLQDLPDWVHTPDGREVMVQTMIEGRKERLPIYEAKRRFGLVLPEER